jgi:hypothetical protein
MSEQAARRVRGVWDRGFALFASIALLVACTREATELPPVRMPEPPPMTCSAPIMVPPVVWPPSCGHRRWVCDGPVTLVVRVESNGLPSEAYLQEERSRALDSCVLRWARKTLHFVPARTCEGANVAGTHTVNLSDGVACDHCQE